MHASSSVGASVFYAQPLLLLGSLGAIFLAGGPMEGGMGIFLTVAGMVLLLIRPLQTAPWVLWGVGGLLLLATATALLPQEWLGNPGVRAFIRPVPILSLPGCITLDPRATLFWMLLLGLSLLIALYSLALPPMPKDMGNLALLAVLGCSCYAILALKAWQTGWVYPFFDKLPWAQPAFGFFPNRNHTAGFLVTGAVLSLGLIHRGVSGRGLFRPFLAACCFSLLVSVLLFTSTSRGGLVFLLIGVILWVGGLGRHRSRAFLFGSIALALVLLMLFLTSGSGLLERLKGHAQESTLAEHSAPSFGEMRLKIWRDTFSIIADYPVTGTGIGTYALIYPFYADKSLRDQSTALHAESDWITLCSENGIPALILVMAGIGLLLSQIPRIAAHSGREWPVRWAFIAACLTELLHGLVDVPLHKPELGWWVLLLGGIGFGNLRDKVPSRLAMGIQRGVFVLGGVLALILGTMMIWAQWGRGNPLPPFAPGVLQKKIVALYGQGDPASAKQAIEEARHAIRHYPMAHPLYFQLAKMLLNSEKNVPMATQLLEAEQAISPNDPDFVFVAGWLLAQDAPMTTASFWNEAIRRQLAYDDSPNSAVHRTGDLYRQMLSTALGNWVLFDRLPAIASNKELRMIWLNQPYCNALLTAEAVSDSSFMEELSTKEQAGLISLWWQRGDKKEVGAFLDAHPEYQEASLGTRLAILVASNQEEKACKLLIERFQIPVPELIGQPSSTIHGAEGEVPNDALAAALYYRKLGNDVAARHYLTEALNNDSTRGEALRLRAVLEMRSGEWKEALADLTAYLQSTRALP